MEPMGFREQPSAAEHAVAGVKFLLERLHPNYDGYSTIAQDPFDEGYGAELELEPVIPLAPSLTGEGRGSTTQKPLPPEQPEQVEQQQEEDPYWQMQQASSLTTFFNLCNTSLGIGILSFALAVEVGRPMPVVLFACLTGVVSCANSRVIVRACVHYKQPTFQGLVRAALGAKLERLSSMVMVAFSFATCAGYLMVIGDYASEVAHELLSPESATPDGGGGDTQQQQQQQQSSECEWPTQWWCCRITLIWAVGVPIVLPLSLRPTVRELSAASAAGISSIGFTVFAVSFRGAWGPKNRVQFDSQTSRAIL